MYCTYRFFPLVKWGEFLAFFEKTHHFFYLLSLSRSPNTIMLRQNSIVLQPDPHCHYSRHFWFYQLCPSQTFSKFSLLPSSNWHTTTRWTFLKNRWREIEQMQSERLQKSIFWQQSENILIKSSVKAILPSRELE